MRTKRLFTSGYDITFTNSATKMENINDSLTVS